MEKYYPNQTPNTNDSQITTPKTTPVTTPNTTPVTAPNTNPVTASNTTTDPVIIPDANAPVELKSPKKEDDDKQPTSKKNPTRTSDVWDHYTKVKGGDPEDPRCTCNYCGADYACHSRRVGTSSLWVHLDKCKKNPERLADKKQKVLSFQRAGDGGTNLLAMTFNKVRCRNALAKFVVKDEQAFRVVEGAGFKEFINELQPKFHVPSRITVARDIYNLFSKERAKLKEEFRVAGQRVCLTTDCWTAQTQISYMCITAHYIDANWNLQKRIINFCQIANHKGDYKGGLVLDVATRWNSTYLMLDVALKFEKAFARYEEEDDKFISFFVDKDNVKKIIGPPTSADWDSASVFVKFLATFYEVTLKFSGTLHVTSNNFYHEICEIHSQLNDLVDANDPLLSIMAVSMKEKYNKYWGNADNINPMLFIAVVLDPRYKMKYLKYCFESVYDPAMVARLVVKVESILQSLYTCYAGSDGNKVSNYMSNLPSLLVSCPENLKIDIPV